MITNRIQSILRGTLALACLLALGMNARAQQTPMVQIPFTGAAMGVPAATYAGTAATACSASTPGYLNSLGDGCPPTQATLTTPYSVTVDSLNNMYVADEGDNRIRVVYRAGTSLAAALVAANPGYSFTPTTGNVYSFGGASALLKATGSSYYCTGTSGTIAYDSYGSGCPAQYAYIYQPRDVAVDRYGNVFYTGAGNRVAVIYVAGSVVANMITTYNPAITVPMSGYVYVLDLSSGDFSSKTTIAVDQNENIFVADTNTLTSNGSGSSAQASSYGNQIKKFTGTGWATYVSSAGYSSKTAPNGDDGSAALGIIQNPNSIVCDAYGNLYIGETRIRVVYNGGPTPPLYVENSATSFTQVTNPTPGNIYTVGGGAASTYGHISGTIASNVYANGSVKSIGVDNLGNVYFANGVYHELWRIDQATGIAVVLGGSGSTTTTGSASTAPAAGATCNGKTGGPLMTDAYADGCPAIQVSGTAATAGIGHIAADTYGNLYFADMRAVSTSPIGIIRGYYFNNQFAAQPVGTTTTVPLAFSPASSSTYTPIVSYALTGNATTEFADGGSDICTVNTGDEGSAPLTCVYNVSFTPALAGARKGAITLTASGSSLGSFPIGGTGTGSQLALDNATQTTLGSGLSPAGVAVDQGGNLFIADATTNALYKSTSGGAPTQIATGFSHPGQVAVDGIGNVYVADTANNRVALVAASGVSSLLTTFSGIALRAPAGVATDMLGNIYVSDTGNNRVLMVSSLGNVSQLAFSGLSSPLGVAIDATGDVFVADSGNARIVELTPFGVQSAITTSPGLVTPVGVTLDAAGTLYIADSGSQNVVKVAAGASAAITVIGNIAGITGIASDCIGNLYLAASSQTGILALSRTQLNIPFYDINVNQIQSVALTLNNTGNVPLVLNSTLSSNTDAVNFAVSAASSNGCTGGASVAVGGNCAVNAIFQPKSVSTFTDTLTFPSSAVNSAKATLTGAGVNAIGTTLAFSYVTPTGGLPLSGQPFTVTATITPTSNGAAISGTILFSVDNAPATSKALSGDTASLQLTLPAGAHTITAVYSGDANYTSSSTSLPVTAVVTAATGLSMAITSSGPAENGIPFTLTATVGSSASQGAITGSVTFVVDGGVPTVVPVTNATAPITLTLAYGPHTILATYSGNSYYLSSNNTYNANVIANGTSTTTISVTSPTGAISYGVPVVVAVTISTANATGTPTGTVVFTADGTPLATVPYAPVIAETLNPPAAGMHTLTASYSGDPNYGPSSGSLSITISRATPAVTLSVTPSVYAAGNNLTFTATVSSPYVTPTGTVTVSNANGTIGTITLVNGTGTYKASTNVLGNYNFTAAYSGDVNMLPEAVSVTPAPMFILSSAAQPSAIMPQGGVATYGMTLNSFYGYAGSITLSCTGLPTNSVCGAYPSISPVTADSSQAVQLQIVTDVSSSLAGMPVTASRRMLWTMLPLLLLLPIMLHKRRVHGVAIALIALIMMASMAGCGSSTRQTAKYVTPTGTYTIQVTASDGAGTSTATVSLNVTQGQ